MDTTLPIATDAIAIEPNQASNQRAWADWAGMLASIGCAIHCAAMPLVIGYLPLLGIGWLADESFHQVMTGICFVLAAAAFRAWLEEASQPDAGDGRCRRDHDPRDGGVCR